MKSIYASLLVISFILALTAFSSSVFAIEASYTYKLHNNIDIKNPCYFNGTYCLSTAVCNITVYDPDNLIIVNNRAMTYQTSYFNYTLPTGNYTIGLYKNDMVCTQSGISGAQTFYFEIITGGNLGLFIVLAISSVLMLGVAIVMKNEYVGFVSGALFIMTGLFAIIYGVGNLSNLYTDSIGYVSLGLGIMFLVAAGYSAAEGSGLFSGDEGGYEDSLDSDTWGSP